MLNFLPDGSITLTIKGSTVASIDPIAANKMNAIDLVLFENNARLHDYEMNNGFFSLNNQKESRKIQIYNHETYGYHLEPEDSFNSCWEENRRKAIDR